MVGGVVRLTLAEARDKLPQMPEILWRVSQEVLRERLQYMVYLAKVMVRVDTGALRDSIRMQWVGSKRHIATVRAGGYITNPNTGRPVDYAVYVEGKYPFMRPAWEEVRDSVLEGLSANVVREVES